MNASPDRSAMMQQEAEEKRKRLARAVADVVEEGHPLRNAALNRGIPEGVLRDALKAQGWVPPHRRGGDGTRRRTFGNGKRHGTKLPPARSDNQS